MYLVTNRQTKRKPRSVAEVFGKKPNQDGPNNLRVAEITVDENGEMTAEILKDLLSYTQAAALKKAFKLDIDVRRSGYLNNPYYIDLWVACKLMQRVQTEHKNILVFVHGFNNDVDAVIRRARQLEDDFGVIVLPFTWPADGGGISSIINYKDDKNDARVSTIALDRFLRFVGKNLQIIRAGQRKHIFDRIQKECPEKNAEERDALYSKLMEKECPFKISLMLHSMGNYLLKQTMKSTTSDDLGLIFDNIILVAPDTNNEAHAEWVDKLRFRNRLYITINENDYALQASRAKGGDAQRARLGHVTHQLGAQRATYVNFTGAEHVAYSHTYFKGDALKNPDVKDFFQTALNGDTVEMKKNFEYRNDLNCYECRED